MPHNQFSHLVLKWFDQHGRKNLPWQKNKTPYRVWVSEIMLQQTQVTTVIPYFERFMQRFPDIESLAAAPENEVLHLWTGLGYYSRARNLFRTAKLIKEQFHSHFPDNFLDLEKCPGIGRSTAGAILAIAFNKKAAILDGNVKRVLTRFHAILEWPGDKKIEEKLWQIAENYTPDQRIADYTQAMMDLGATVCTRSKPRCDICPLKKSCGAHQLNLENKIPHPKPRTTLPERETYFLIVCDPHNRIFLQQKPAQGIWGNLWSFPEVNFSTLSELKKFCRKTFSSEIKKYYQGGKFRHTFSHFRLEITPIFIHLTKAPLKIMEHPNQIWYNLSHPEKIGIPAPVKKILEKLHHATHDLLHQIE